MIRASLSVPHSSKSTSPSPSTTLLHLLLLRIPSPRRLGVAQELPRIMMKSQKVYIVLFFMGIDSENRADLGGNLGGIWLKETRLFVSTSTEMYATFVVDQTSETNLVSSCISCIYFSLHVLWSSCS
jgi:hypothetical protein